MIFEALDEDVTSNDLIGKANPLSFNSLTQDIDQKSMLMDLYDDNFKHTGSLEVISHYVQRVADPIPRGLNNRCKLFITILEGSFKENHDAFGNQDPYIVFDFGGKTISTKVQDDAGLFAEFNETFTLDNIYEEILNGLELQLHAWDKDVLDSDFIGLTEPILWQDFVHDTLEQVHEVELLSKKHKNVGSLKFKTKLSFVAPPKPSMNHEANNHLWYGVSTLNG